MDLFDCIVCIKMMYVVNSFDCNGGGFFLFLIGFLIKVCWMFDIIIKFYVKVNNKKR